MSEREDKLEIYAVRPSDKVADQIEAEHQRLVSVSGADAADHWEDSLADAIASLATLPKRCPVAEEDTVFARVRPGQILRVLIHRQTAKSAAWRILFSISEADKNDAPTVRIQHIRHGAQAPMTEWPADENE